MIVYWSQTDIYRKERRIEENGVM